jgi:hypothetical protein
MGEKQAVTALFPQKLDEPRRQHAEAERPCTDQSRLAKRFTATLRFAPPIRRESAYLRREGRGADRRPIRQT